MSVYLKSLVVQYCYQHLECNTVGTAKLCSVSLQLAKDKLGFYTILIYPLFLIYKKIIFPRGKYKHGACVYGH